MRYAKRILVLLLALLLAAPGAWAEHAARVTADLMEVYDDQAMTWKLGSLKKGAVVTVISEEGSAARIAYMGKYGYAASASLESLGEAKEVTVKKTATVYQLAGGSGRSVNVKKGTKVLLLATSGSIAMIGRNGYIGYTALKNLSDGSQGGDVVYETYRATVSEDGTPVYASASASSKLLGRMKQGAQVTVVAYNDEWACLKNGTKYGFCDKNVLKRNAVQPETPEDDPQEEDPKEDPGEKTGDGYPNDFDAAVRSGKYSNEELCYIFLTREMKLNTAAACGILSNIKSESDFLPTVYYGGSYGICQWLGTRLTKMKNFCSERGYDYNSLSGQLRFLAYELEKEFPRIDSYMRGVANSANGAYDAGYYWCYYYEIPSNRASRSVTRGNAARDTYWAKYHH